MSTDYLPRRVKYCIVGAGIHGLSAAYHLALELKEKTHCSSNDILVIDKSRIAAGASGIACGVVRNNYFQPAMSAVMTTSMNVWEQYADQLSYNSVGYIAIAGPQQSRDLHTIAKRHHATGHPHTFVEGVQQCREYLRRIFPDWKDSDAAAVLHEHRGGFAYSREAVVGLAKLVCSQGVQIVLDIEVTGFDFRSDETVSAVRTSSGTLEVETVIVAVGPWIKKFWTMLALPAQIDVRGQQEQLYPKQDMWSFWQLQEGEVELEDDIFTLANGGTPPVVHVDSEEPLRTEDGVQITKGPWGIYFKRHLGNVQGGAVPVALGTNAEIDPYGAESPYYTVDSDFIDYWTAGLARSLKRFERCRNSYKRVPSGGIGCFTVDNFPVFDFMRPNVYVIADSNHGFKMIGIGKEVATVVTGGKSNILKPFRFRRFVDGDLHPVSSSPFPWS